MPLADFHIDPYVLVPAFMLGLVVGALVDRWSWRMLGKDSESELRAHYPAAELVAAVMFAAIAARYGLVLETFELLVFSGCLLFLTLTDLEERIIPDGCIIVAIAARAVYLAALAAAGFNVAGESREALIGALVLGLGILALVLVADRIFKRDSMGGGDVKLYAVAGLYFGWYQGMILVIVSCVLGLVFSFIRREREIPFGPSIALACVIMMLLG